jgi:hypothetical protein
VGGSDYTGAKERSGKTLQDAQQVRNDEINSRNNAYDAEVSKRYAAGVTYDDRSKMPPLPPDPRKLPEPGAATPWQEGKNVVTTGREHGIWQPGDGRNAPFERRRAADQIPPVSDATYTKLPPIGPESAGHNFDNQPKWLRNQTNATAMKQLKNYTAPAFDWRPNEAMAEDVYAPPAEHNAASTSTWAAKEKALDPNGLLQREPTVRTSRDRLSTGPGAHWQPNPHYGTPITTLGRTSPPPQGVHPELGQMWNSPHAARAEHMPGSVSRSGGFAEAAQNAMRRLQGKPLLGALTRP